MHDDTFESFASAVNEYCQWKKLKEFDTENSLLDHRQLTASYEYWSASKEKKTPVKRTISINTNDDDYQSDSSHHSDSRRFKFSRLEKDFGSTLSVQNMVVLEEELPAIKPLLPWEIFEVDNSLYHVNKELITPVQIDQLNSTGFDQFNFWNNTQYTPKLYTLRDLFPKQSSFMPTFESAYHLQLPCTGLPRPMKVPLLPFDQNAPKRRSSDMNSSSIYKYVKNMGIYTSLFNANREMCKGLLHNVTCLEKFWNNNTNKTVLKPGNNWSEFISEKNNTLFTAAEHHLLMAYSILSEIQDMQIKHNEILFLIAKGYLGPQDEVIKPLMSITIDQ
jgi:hypothetical protein